MDDDLHPEDEDYFQWVPDFNLLLTLPDEELESEAARATDEWCRDLTRNMWDAGFEVRRCEVTADTVLSDSESEGDARSEVDSPDDDGADDRRPQDSVGDIMTDAEILQHFENSLIRRFYHAQLRGLCDEEVIDLLAFWAYMEAYFSGNNDLARSEDEQDASVDESVHMVEPAQSLPPRTVSILPG